MDLKFLKQMPPNRLDRLLDIIDQSKSIESNGVHIDKTNNFFYMVLAGSPISATSIKSECDDFGIVPVYGLKITIFSVFFCFQPISNQQSSFLFSTNHHRKKKMPTNQHGALIIFSGYQKSKLNSNFIMNDPLEWFNEIPIISRLYLAGAFLTTAACALDLVSPFTLYFNFHLIFYRGQVRNDTISNIQ